MSRETKRGIFDEIFSVIGAAYMAAATVTPYHRPDAQRHNARPARSR